MTLQNAKYGEYSEEFKAWIAAADLKAMAAFATLPIDLARAGIKKGEDSVNGFTSVTFEDHQIIAPGVTARVFKQKTTNTAEPSSPRPLLMIYHGGGWCVGGHTTQAVLTRTVVGKLGFVGVSIDYRLAPEHPFPTPFNDCYDGFQWAIKNASKFGADPNCVFVGGSSAGANLAAAVAMKARDEGHDNIKGQLLVIPIFCHYGHLPKDKFELNSYDQLPNVPILSANAMRKFWDAYDPVAEPNPYVSPLLASSHAGLPSTYMQIAGADVLRHEALAYAKVLESAGVDIKLDIYPGLPHAFCAPQIGLVASCKKAEDDLEQQTKWLLSLVKGSSGS